MRLTRSEINMAYRQSDMERMQQFDFIVGYEVKLSKSRPPDFYDICDELKGKYPKDFNFKGWHPQCLCHVITINLTNEELNELERREFSGKDTGDIKSKNTVTSVPKGFKDWVVRNQQRAKGWKSQPYFIKDNFKGGSIQGGLNDNIPGFVIPPLPQTQINPPSLLKPTSQPTAKPTPAQKTRVPEQSQQVAFEPAKTIKEAESWALKNLGVKYADFGAIHVDVANDINRVMHNIKRLMPDITTAGIGSAQKANRAMKNDILTAYRASESYKKYTTDYGVDFAEKRAKKFASSIVGNVRSDVVAWSTNRESTSIAGYGKVDLSKYRGVYFNEKYSKDVNNINGIVDRMEKSGFYTKNAKGAGYIMSHEVGHEIDKSINFRNSQEFKLIYDKHTKFGTAYVSSNLSKYGATANGKASHKPLEFIAESWAEYVTSPNPRPIAMEIGEAMLRVYHKEHLANQGVNYIQWKESILKILKR